MELDVGEEAIVEIGLLAWGRSEGDSDEREHSDDGAHCLGDLILPGKQ